MDPTLPDVDLDRDMRAFWLLQLAGWGFYGLATFLTFLTSVEPQGWQWLFLFKAVIRPSVGIAVSSALALVLRAAETRGGAAVAATAVLGSLIGAVAWYLTSRLLFVFSRGESVPSLWPENPHGLWEYVFVMLAWSASFLGVRAWRRSRERERRALEAEARATEARLGLLAAQLDPHFLFNALSSLRGLIRRDPERAEGVVTKLASFLRSALVQPKSREVTLEEELTVVEAYMEVERARLGDALEVRTEIDDDALAARVPVFLLYPLVENAIKYGGGDDGVRVVIRGRREGGRLRIGVSNPGRLADGVGGGRPAGTGVGLANLRERLTHTHPGRHRFELVEENNWVHARIELEEREADGEMAP